MVKRLKMLTALMLAMMLIVSACSTNNSTSTQPNTEPNPEPPKAEKVEEAYELVMSFPVFGPVPRDMQKLEDAINEIAKKEINATVKLKPINIGAYGQQTNLMLSSNEKLDLLMVSFRTIDGLVSKGSLIELDDLVEKHGPGIKEVLGDFLKASKMNNKQYVVPNYNDMAEATGLLIPKKHVDEYGIDLSKIKNISDLEYVFEKIKAGNPKMAPFAPNGVGFSILDHYRWFDPLGDNIGVLPDFDNNLKVVNLYESAEYAEVVQLLRKWYQAGYILKDAATNQDSAQDLIKSGRAASMLGGMKPDLAEEMTVTYQTEMVSVPLTDAVATTRNVVGLNWGIPINSKNPEKAMQFLNLMFTNKEIMSLLHWGIEGEHYVKVGENVIDFPAGIDLSSTGYGMRQTWMFGNQFGSGYVWKGTDPNMPQMYKDFNENAKRSKALGFAFNSADVKNEYSAVSNVISQYKLPLETGSVDPAKVLPEFISKLKAAGIDKIIEEKQRQLDEWAKNQ